MNKAVLHKFSSYWSANKNSCYCNLVFLLKIYNRKNVFAFTFIFFHSTKPYSHRQWHWTCAATKNHTAKKITIIIEYHKHNSIRFISISRAYFHLYIIGIWLAIFSMLFHLLYIDIVIKTHTSTNFYRFIPVIKFCIIRIAFISEALFVT